MALIQMTPAIGGSNRPSDTNDDFEFERIRDFVPVFDDKL
jgi:hypothetical protein